MTLFITVADFPRPGDRHESTRDLDTFINTHDVVRQYRDYLAVTIGPAKAYEHITYVLVRSLRLYFRDHFENPYYKFFIHVDTLADQGLMEASMIAMCEQLGSEDRIREREREIMSEITGGTATIDSGFFPDDWDHLARMRRLYAMLASSYAQEMIPEVPLVAEILAREFGGDVVLPCLTSGELSDEERLEIRALVAKESAEDALARLEACLPPGPEPWDSQATLVEIREAIVRTFLDRVEDDGFMDRWIEKVRPQLGEYGEPREENMRAIEAFLADTERRRARRFHDMLHPRVLAWIATAEACGHPLDERVLEMAGYQAP